MKSKQKTFRSPITSDGIFQSNMPFYLIPLAVLCGWVFIRKPPTVSGYYLIHYLYTYKHGFVPRGLIGEIISWFTDSVSDKLIETLAVSFSLVLAVSASLCIGKALSKVKHDKQNLAVVSFIILVLCIMPGSFRMYFDQMTQDKLLWAMTLFAVLLCDRKYAIWFAPLLCVIATLINPVYLFCSMILIAIILLQEFKSGGYSVKNGIICAVSYISMIAIGLFGPLSEKKLGFQTPRELLDFYFSRYAGQLDDATRHLFETEWLFDYFEPFDKVLKLTFQIYFKEWGNAQRCLISFIFTAVPAFILFAVFWKKVMKNEPDKFQKFIFFLCAVSPVVIVPVTVISWEFTKYFYNNIIVQACLIIYYIVRKNSSVLKTVGDIVRSIRKNPIPFAAVVAYFAVFTV